MEISYRTNLPNFAWMVYLLELRFEDPGYNALVHFLATFQSQNDNDALAFRDELVSGFERNGATGIRPEVRRVEDNPESLQLVGEYIEFYQRGATVSINLEQFLLDNPDQEKSLSENLTQKIFAGTDSVKHKINEYNIPVRVRDRNSLNPISGDFFYYYMQQLIPRNR